MAVRNYCSEKLSLFGCSLNDFALLHFASCKDTTGSRYYIWSAFWSPSNRQSGKGSFQKFTPGLISKWRATPQVTLQTQIGAITRLISNPNARSHISQPARKRMCTHTPSKLPEGSHSPPIKDSMLHHSMRNIRFLGCANTTRSKQHHEMSKMYAAILHHMLRIYTPYHTTPDEHTVPHPIVGHHGN
jgi:hypothetical protein